MEETGTTTEITEIEETEATQEEYTEQEEIVQDPQAGETEPTQEVQETIASDQYMYIESDQIDLTNHLLAGQIFFLGVIFGVLLFKVFWDRWKV